MPDTAPSNARLSKELVDEPPSVLKRLVRTVCRGFYSPEQTVIMDYLVKLRCIKEDDLVDLLKFDKKQFRQNILLLKQDQLIKSRKRVETDSDGKMAKLDVYFINYQVFVNVVKYKLDRMQRRLENEQRETTARPAFKCTGCDKFFTDLEIDQLIDMSSGLLKCTFCSSEVHEEENQASRQDLRVAMARFHEQIRDPIDSMLRDIENFTLSKNLLDPQLNELSTGSSISSTKLSLSQNSSHTWSGEIKRGAQTAEENATSVVVSIDDGKDTTDSSSNKKEQPVWMAASTVINSGMFDDNSNMSKGSSDTNNDKEGPSHDEIEAMLMQHEHKAEFYSTHVVGSGGRGRKAKNKTFSLPSRAENGSDSDSEPLRKQTRQDDSELDEMSDFEDEEEDVFVSVQGDKVEYHQINDEMIKRMTPKEKEDYAATGQRLFGMLDD